jgi:hypothetical protein
MKLPRSFVHSSSKGALDLVMIGASNPVVEQSYGDNSSSFHVSASGEGELSED